MDCEIGGEGRAARAASNRSRTMDAMKRIESGVERSDKNK
jgi:hypothetical protein